MNTELFLIIFNSNSTISSYRRYFPPKILRITAIEYRLYGISRAEWLRSVGKNSTFDFWIHFQSLFHKSRSGIGTSVITGYYSNGGKHDGRLGFDNYLSWRGERAVWITDGLGSRGTATSEWATLRGGSGDVAAGTTDFS